MSKESFSFQEMHNAEKTGPGDDVSLQATDGIKLSLRRYSPVSPRAAVLFYHGGGAHSGKGYQYIGHGLQTKYDIAVYTPDIRGHGISEGPRGDTPGPRQVWADITTAIRSIREEFPHLPLFLGGHSSGAGLALNYMSQNDREPVFGCVFLSPQLGYKSQTDRPGQSAPFAKVDTSAFIDYATSGGAARAHDYAVKFNYPAEILSADAGMVSAITVAMSVALTPFSPDEQFAGLHCPFGLWIGSEDELFLPEKVLSFAEKSPAARLGSQAGIVKGANHLSILLHADDIMGRWIISCIKNTK
jgi:acylglycerol lipase